MNIAVHFHDAVKSDQYAAFPRLLDRNFKLVTRNHRLYEFEPVNFQEHIEILFEIFGWLFDYKRAKLSAA